MAQLSTQQKRELRKLRGRLPRISKECREAECFLLMYIGFESQARKIWHYYRCRKSVKAVSTQGIPLPELVKAMSFFEISLEDNVLNELLDSTLEKRGNKSARNLRNGMVHQWNEADCMEASGRKKEFHSIFKEFDVAIGSVL